MAHFRIKAAISGRLILGKDVRVKHRRARAPLVSRKTSRAASLTRNDDMGMTAFTMAHGQGV
jgi:hypothetical protein